MTHCLKKVELKALLSLIPLVIGTLLYSAFSTCLNFLILNLFSESAIISQIVSTFSVTLLGFLSAAIVILSGIKNNYYWKKYEQDGYAGAFYFAYYGTMLYIIFVYITTLLAIKYFCWFKIMLAGTIVNIIQVIYIIMIAHRASVNIGKDKNNP